MSDADLCRHLYGSNRELLDLVERVEEDELRYRVEALLSTPDLFSRRRVSRLLVDFLVLVLRCRGDPAAKAAFQFLELAVGYLTFSLSSDEWGAVAEARRETVQQVYKGTIECHVWRQVKRYTRGLRFGDWEEYDQAVQGNRKLSDLFVGVNGQRLGGLPLFVKHLPCSLQKKGE